MFYFSQIFTVLQATGKTSLKEHLKELAKKMSSLYWLNYNEFSLKTKTMISRMSIRLEEAMEDILLQLWELDTLPTSSQQL